jgi:hypothetical protein
VTWRGLAAAVAERLAPHAPEGLVVREEPEGFLQAWVDEARWESYPLDEPDVEEEIDPATYDPPYPAFAVLEALDFVQEYARNELGADWPGEAWAELTAGEIRFGIGEADLPPIPLAELNPA